MNDDEIDILLIKLKTLKVLYVEDNDEVREQTLEMLKIFFVDIHTSVDGEKALDVFKSVEGFNLILTDINMPIMDGIEMARLIRELDSDIPIVAMSAHNEKKILQNIKKYNIAKYIFKPIDLDEFLEVLQKIFIKT